MTSEPGYALRERTIGINNKYTVLNIFLTLLLVEVSGTFALQFGSFFFSITMFVEEGCKCEEGDELKSEEDELEGSPAAGERVTAGISHYRNFVPYTFILNDRKRYDRNDRNETPSATHLMVSSQLCSNSKKKINDFLTIWISNI